MADSYATIKAVKDFRSFKKLEYGLRYKLNVYIKEIGDNDITVQLSIPDINSYNINIYWEEVFEDYKSLNLFGYYSTRFCKMNFKDGNLIIFDSNGKKILIS